jgi:hypothetical protein
MTKIVINKSYGGFNLSEKGFFRYNALVDVQERPWNIRNIERDDPALVQTVEELGEAANGYYAKLAVIEIPEGVKWEIQEYDGLEHVAEKHRVWS